MTVSEKARQSITDKFHAPILTKFKKAVKDYRLVSDGDRVLMCISGGKDSMLCALLLEELQLHGNIDFSVGYLSLDPGYSAENLLKLRENAEILDIPLHIEKTEIFREAAERGKNPCFSCASRRRTELYKYAEKNGYNKISLGHHFDDVIETVLMGMIYGGQMQTMLPRRKSDHFKGIELIRPMCLVREENIIEWAEYNDLSFMACGCSFAESKAGDSKRAEIKALIKELRARNPQIEHNIFRSAENVNLRNLMSYKDENGIHTFLDDF